MSNDTLPGNVNTVIARLRDRIGRRRSLGYRDAPVPLPDLERLIEMASRAEPPRARLVRLATAERKT